MNDLPTILADCSHLRDGTPVVLGLTSSELIQEQVQMRKEMKARIREAKSHLDDAIAELDAQKRVLNIAQSYLTTDTEKIVSYFWEVLREERDATRDTRPKQ